jgi:hypothetical protein
MARFTKFLSSEGSGVRGGLDIRQVPLAPWGSVHNLTVGSAARNSTAFAARGSIVTLVALDGGAHFATGDSSVTATTNDKFLPSGVYVDVPLFGGQDHVSIVTAASGGATKAQIIERC